jgi:hypothetical protein
MFQIPFQMAWTNAYIVLTPFESPFQEARTQVSGRGDEMGEAKSHEYITADKRKFLYNIHGNRLAPGQMLYNDVCSPPVSPQQCPLVIPSLEQQTTNDTTDKVFVTADEVGCVYIFRTSASCASS